MILKYEMDGRWEGRIPACTQKGFEERAESLISPNESVPDIVKQKLQQVKSIYRLRSIDYELQDVAVFLMLIVFELALRTKYEEVKGSETRKGLTPLLQWAKKNNYLDISKNQSDHLVNIRNAFAHIKRPEDLHGTLASFDIERINDWINELYSK